ncbi:glycosyltransferase family 2 protein [Corallincola luteus]|uniref:Glycosyltransferase family 2 protein n=1 Tax=Corallincola luteus TaxID=1775177 RepID=A0ABY2AQV3_9GAMM|nr:glycosyltransferase family A protein [Corallincola luteus]TCI04958.1 glycosyltransferase family 2 protein [Corallincola luteus]
MVDPQNDVTPSRSEPPLVSVITPVFRGENTLLRAVESLLAQDYSHWEQWIVVDDGVDYQQLLASHGICDPRIHFISSGEIGSGPNHTRNLALAKARGALIAPLDADDLYYPTRLSTLVPLAMEYGVAGDNVDVVDEQNGQLMATLLPQYQGYRLWSAAGYSQTKTPLIFLFRRDCVGLGWHRDVQLGEDTLFNLRAMERAKGCVMWGEPLHQYRVNSESICHSDNAAERADMAYQHCLDRLLSDAMGFGSEPFKRIVETMLRDKKRVNLAYDAALKNGFAGSYQHFSLKHYPLDKQYVPQGTEELCIE